MIDVISGGRLIAGMVVGGGPEYYSFSVNPTHARERFREALDLIMKAWTEPGPFEWVGKHYRIRYVNPWPRPLQQPHPPDLDPRRRLARDDRVRRPATATRTWASRTSTSTSSSATSRCSATRARPRATPPTRCRRAGCVPIYVAETDEQARQEYEEHLWYFVKRLLPGITIQPPGYTSARSLGSILKSAGHVHAQRRDVGARSSRAATRSSARPRPCADS